MEYCILLNVMWLSFFFFCDQKILQLTFVVQMGISHEQLWVWPEPVWNQSTGGKPHKLARARNHNASSNHCETG